MQMLENIHLAINSLLGNKMRSLLTMLGIIIGIGSVIAIVTVGDSITGNVNEQMSGFGGKNVTVGVQQRPDLPEETDGEVETEYLYDPYSYMEYEEPGADDLLTLEMITDYEENFREQLEAVSLSENVGSCQLTNGRAKASVELSGVNQGFAIAEKLELLSGRWIRQTDLDDSRHVALVTDKFLTAYWGNRVTPEEVLGRDVTVEIGGRTVKLYLIGVFHEPDNGMYSYDSGSSRMLLPATLAKELSGKSKGYQSITVAPKAEVDSATFLKNTGAYFMSYYTQNKKFTVQATSNESFIKTMNETMQKLKLGIGAIAAISLLVGGIGVMNIMMVSVTERTREIGVRMALGAKSRVILFQFIVEAMIICLIGGMIGVVLGCSLGSVAANAMQFAAKPSITAILLAVGFSMAIGLFFGYYPARKAAMLDPIEALRYE